VNAAHASSCWRQLFADADAIIYDAPSNRGSTSTCDAGKVIASGADRAGSSSPHNDPALGLRLKGLTRGRVFWLSYR
jgi:hypothetical protein